MILNEQYETSKKELKNLQLEKEIVENLTAQDVALAESLEGILQSEVLTLTSPNSNYSLVLSAETNRNIFEAVGLVAISEVTCESLTEEEQPGEQVELTEKKECEEDEDEDEEDEDEDEDEEDEDEESMSESEAEQMKEALADLLMKDSFVFEGSEGTSFVINENHNSFASIKEAMLETLISLAEATDELEVAYAFVEHLEALNEGIALNEAEDKGAKPSEKEGFWKRLAKKAGELKGKVGETWKSGKLGKAKVLGIPAAVAAGGAGLGVGIHKFRKRGQEIEALKAKLKELGVEESYIAEAEEEEEGEEKPKMSGTKKALIGAGALGAAGAGALGARQIAKGRFLKGSSEAGVKAVGEVSNKILGQTKGLARLAKMKGVKTPEAMVGLTGKVFSNRMGKEFAKGGWAKAGKIGGLAGLGAAGALAGGVGIKHLIDKRKAAKVANESYVYEKKDEEEHETPISFGKHTAVGAGIGAGFGGVSGGLLGGRMFGPKGALIGGASSALTHAGLGALAGLGIGAIRRSNQNARLMHALKKKEHLKTNESLEEAKKDKPYDAKKKLIAGGSVAAGAGLAGLAGSEVGARKKVADWAKRGMLGNIESLPKEKAADVKKTFLSMAREGKELKTARKMGMAGLGVGAGLAGAAGIKHLIDKRKAAKEAEEK